jgi:hypothetical protein
MNEFLFIVGSTWHVCLIISFFLFLIYAYNRRSNAEYLHVVVITGAVETLVFAVIMCWEVVVGATCYTDFIEKTCILFGAVAIIWQVTRELKKLIFTSQPH